MNLFGKTKKVEDLILIFDIGSSSVGGAFFRVQKDGSPKIIYTIREPFLLSENVKIDELFNIAIQALKVVATKASLQGLGVPSKIFCVLASPWHASQTRKIKYEQNSPFLFTKELADSLIQKEISNFELEHSQTPDHSISKIKTIEVKNMKTVLNGYTLNEPLNKKAKELEMTIFISMSHEEIFTKIEEAINRHFASSTIIYASFLMASFVVGRDLFINQEKFVLVNIGGEITEVSMVKKDILSESSSFPMGRNFIIRGFANELKISLDEARSTISMYKDSHVEKTYAKNVDQVLLKIKTEWLKSFQSTLASLSRDISIPATIFITVSDDLASFFADTIRTEQFNQYTLTESKFRVVFLNTQSLHGIALFEDNVVRDVPLLIESIYINRFLV